MEYEFPENLIHHDKLGDHLVWRRQRGEVHVYLCRFSSCVECYGDSLLKGQFKTKDGQLVNLPGVEIVKESYKDHLVILMNRDRLVVRGVYLDDENRVIVETFDGKQGRSYYHNLELGTLTNTPVSKLLPYRVHDNWWYLLSKMITIDSGSSEIIKIMNYDGWQHPSGVKVMKDDSDRILVTQTMDANTRVKRSLKWLIEESSPPSVSIPAYHQTVVG